MKKHIAIILFVNLIYSCGNTELVDPSKLTVAPYGINIIMDSIILKDTGTYFKIASRHKDYEIVSAYFDCGKKTIRDYDTLKRKLKDCEKNLLIVNDTVKIYIEPFKLGENKFEDLTLLISDKSGRLFFIDTTFYFNVLNAPPR